MRLVWVVFALSLILVPAWGLQAFDAESALVQGNYLEPNEKAAVFKSLPQKSGTSMYWLVSILQNDSLKTIIPISDKDGKPVEKGVLRTNLISANLLVQRLSLLKTQTSWLVSLPTVNKLEELANAVENETFDVDIVSQTVTNNSLKGDVGVLKGKLETMAVDLRGIAGDIKSLSEQEVSFLNVSIDTSIVNGVGSAYADIFSAIDVQKDAAAEYDQQVSKVKNQIASDSSLDTQTKSQLLGLLSPLGVNQSLSSALSPYADSAAENAQRVSVEVAGIPTKVSALEAEADARTLRSQSYSVLYGLDPSFQKSTGFDSLSQGVLTLLAEENGYRWKDQVNVQNLLGAWENAENAFAKKQYATAAELGNKAKGLVKTIKGAGIEAEVDPSQQASDTLITGLAYILVGVALIVGGRTLLQWVKARQAEENE
ncbi:MAG: hypothetical protein AABW68_05330 [archaeon]